MRILSLITCLSALLLFGCSSTDNGSTPEEPLNFDVIGSDTPDSYAAAMDELTAIEISVPEPVTAELMRECNPVGPDADLARLQRVPLDDGERERFRRIIRHLHERFRLLHDCLENSDSRELRRVAYGAHLAFRRGMRALEDGHPRAALEAFHRANRLLNLAQRLCRQGGG